MSHAQIAEVVGFADEFAFSKAFEAAHGESPRAYRQAAREASPLGAALPPPSPPRVSPEPTAPVVPAGPPRR